MMRFLAVIAITVLAAAPALAPIPAFAGAPQPRKALDLSRVMGRWYEIARTPNPGQRDCFAATTEWAAKGGGRYEVVQTCRKGSAVGPAKAMRCGAVLTDAATNAKWRLSFFGGLVRQEYWVVDRADDHGWILFGTPGGNYLWLLARKPTLTPAQTAEAKARAVSLGYDLRKLVFAG